jgi:hypothetical protein
MVFKSWGYVGVHRMLLKHKCSLSIMRTKNVRDMYGMCTGCVRVHYLTLVYPNKLHRLLHDMASSTWKDAPIIRLFN